MSDVKLKVGRKPLPTLPATPSLPGAATQQAHDTGLGGGLTGSPGALTDRLKDPLAPSAAPAGSQQKAPSLTQMTSEKAVQSEAPKGGQGQLPGGQKVLRTLFLDVTGKVPWGQVAYLMGLDHGVPAAAKAAVEAAMQGQKFREPYLELINDGGDLALQIEDKERLAVGPLTLVPGWAAKNVAAADAAQAGRSGSEAGRRTVERLEGVVGAARGRLDSLESDGKAVAGGAESKAARTVRLAGASRTLEGLRQAEASAKADVDTLEQLAKAAGTDTDGEQTRAAAERARALLGHLQDVITRIQEEVATLRQGAAQAAGDEAEGGRKTTDRTKKKKEA